MASNRMPRAPHPDRPLALLAGLTPKQFLRRHWQRKPLVIRGAIPAFVPPVTRAALFALARRAGVEARLVAHDGRKGWTLAHGPFAKSALRVLGGPRRTLLVQGVDLHDEAAHTLLQRFRFVPDARLDDLMISWASDGGGVGPHVDSYDVFLLQAQGWRRWRIGRPKDVSLRRGVPLKMLRRFAAEQEHVLGPGDMLYLPPNWAHDGVAVGGECMTCSIGFRAPRRAELAVELAQRLADLDAEDSGADRPYADRRLAATRRPGRVPAALQAFAVDALLRFVTRPREIAAALGELLTEPKTGVSFPHRAARWSRGAVALDRRTRILYDDEHVFINGESYRASGDDARLMRRLADDRCLDAHAVRRASRAARLLLREWVVAGWLRPGAPRVTTGAGAGGVRPAAARAQRSRGAKRD